MFYRDLNGVTDFGYTWGMTGGVPATGDWNGHGNWGIAIFRPSEGRWRLTMNPGWQGKSVAFPMGERTPRIARDLP